MSDSTNESVFTRAARARSAAQLRRRFGLDAAAIVATVFVAELLVMLALNDRALIQGSWRVALLDAGLLSLVLAAPLYGLIRMSARAGERDKRWKRPAAAPAPLRQHRLRAVLYGLVLIMGLSGGWQLWRALRTEETRQADAELIALSGQQRIQCQRIGRLAALAALAPDQAQANLAELQDSLAAMQQAARRMNTLAEQQYAAGSPQSDHVNRLLGLVAAQQVPLWEHAGKLAQTPPEAVAPIALDLQAEADVYLREMDALANELQAKADARSRGIVEFNREWALLRLGLLICLVLAVLEPLVRTLRRQQERLMAQAEETNYLALAAQRTGNGVVFTDLEHRIVWVNAGFTRMAGYELHEVAGRMPGSVLGTERTMPETVHRLWQAVTLREATHVQVCNRAKDGHEYWVEVDLQPLSDEHGTPTGFVEIQSDITEQVLQRQHMAKLIETMPVGLLVSGADGLISECNDAACRILGLAADQLLGRSAANPPWHFLREDGAALPAENHPIVVTQSTAQPVSGAVIGVQMPAGGLRWVSIDTHPLVGRDGEVESVIACLVDLTESRAQGARLGLIVEGAALGTWELDLATGNARFNDRWWRMLGYEPGQLGADSQTWRQLIHPDDLHVMHAVFDAQPKNASASFQTELRMKNRSGAWAWVFVAGAVIERDGTGRPILMAGVHVDIDRAKRAEAAIDEARTRAEHALSELRAYQAALDKHALVAVTDPAGVIKHANARFCQISQYSREELVGQTHHMLTSGMHPRQFWTDMWRQIAGGHSWHGEICNRSRDGSLHWLETTIVPVLDKKGKVLEHMAIRTETTKRKQLEEQLRRAALTDGLTQLPNRASMLDKLQGAVLRARRLHDYRFALLFMDFDRFKLVNDSLGHDVGDELLRQIALRLRLALREGDTLSRADDAMHTAARIGGDEFVILLDGIHDVEDAELVARRLLLVLSQPYQIGQHEVHSSASIGVVTSDTNHGDADALLRDADTAMYEAKRGGRGRYVLFDATMHERVARTLDIENDLRRGLQHDEFFVAYQPIVDLASGELRGVEALARWRHPERGLVPPLEFIPIAEETGLITALGARVLSDACDQFMSWRASLGPAAPSSVAVNLSRAQLCQSDLTEVVQHELLRTGMQPQCLRLEVTESLAMQDGGALAVLHRLKALGVSLALDDFGTGYSSLACLHEIPVDVLKIDRSFVSQLAQSNHRRVLIQATVLVARALGIQTVAEGVETPEQAHLLVELGCSMAQGFLFGRPMVPPDFATWQVEQPVRAPDQLLPPADG